MTPQTALAPEYSPGVWSPSPGHSGVAERLQACARLLQEHVKSIRPEAGPPTGASRWLLDNHSFIQSQIGEIKRNLRPSYLRELSRMPDGQAKDEPRVYRIAAELVSETSGAIDYPKALSFAETAKKHALNLSELWAFGLMLRLAIVERLPGVLETESAVSNCIRSLWALDGLSWREFVESASVAEDLLRADPAGVYPRMDFETRDLYRHALEKLTKRSRLSEQEIARALLERAESVARAHGEAARESHIGFYLIGSGAREFRRRIQCTRLPLAWAGDLAELYPNAFYISGVAILTVLIVLALLRLAGPFPRWAAALLLVPASQAALEIVNALVSRLLKPRLLPSMDFADGIPSSSKTIAVVPTLLLSPANVTKLLEDLEIRYLANRDPNLYFALLTDFPDAASREADNDSVLAICMDGIVKLNRAYGSGHAGPFYLFHRARTWNAREGKWMGYERKRGKLNDLNRLLLGEGNWFDTIAGDLSRLRDVRYVITLDSDTRLPRDTALKMVGAMAHPLNRPVIDRARKIVTEGYALMRPRIAVSMESAGRSRLAQIFSGQPGFDTYATSVSDVYQDLHGQASFTGKGIYDVRAFHTAVGDRFPENAILSHDLIEGEHARTGLLTSIDLVEDYPATYRAFSKRKHRWIRGDWQLLPWLTARPPAGTGRGNPLSLLSRWKILDNLRRSVFEISILLLLVAGWLFIPHSARWTLAVLLVLQLPAYADLLLTALKSLDMRWVPAFWRHLGCRLLQSHRDTLVTLAFIPHQACLMTDAIVRTLGRLFITKRHLLEWETMAQSESAAGTRIGMVEWYLYFSALAWLPFLFIFQRLNIVVALVGSLWVVAPLIVQWLNEPLSGPAELSKHERTFLRDAALRTWRYFADHACQQNHWLVPDNIQQDPPLVAHGISPTNLGLLLTANLAAHDFGFVGLDQLSRSLQRIFDSMQEMPRYRGHFFNWYDTRTLHPMPPHYVSSVDSGNLGASLCALRQGCLLLLAQPVLNQSIVAGLRDHALRLRDELPYSARTRSLMMLLANLLRQLECEPSDLFYWEALLTDVRDLVQRIREALVATHDHLCRQGDRAKSDELRYWEDLLVERSRAALSELYRLAPWVESAFEPELRVSMRDATFTALFAEISQVPVLIELPETYHRISEQLTARLASSAPLYPALRAVLEQLIPRLSEARASAAELIHRIDDIAESASAAFDGMEFRFLFDEHRKLLRIGYNVDKAERDQSCYDLLASEARTAVFLAIAKGDIPREAWFRLSRKRTRYRDQPALLSWSGTMFEYLMPLLYLRSHANTLLEQGMRGAIRIQQLYGQERNVPWGISESSYSERDARMQYQYRAFGVPALSASSDRSDRLVIAPYATMLALMLDPARATANLRTLAAKGYRGRYGFFEAIDYSPGNGAPEPIRSFMAHHQGMSLLAIDNALFSGRMQARFHREPFVQATEFLLEERMPALVEDSAGGGEQTAAA